MKHLIFIILFFNTLSVHSTPRQYTLDIDISANELLNLELKGAAERIADITAVATLDCQPDGTLEVVLHKVKHRTPLEVGYLAPQAPDYSICEDNLNKVSYGTCNPNDGGSLKFSFDVFVFYIKNFTEAYQIDIPVVSSENDTEYGFPTYTSKSPVNKYRIWRITRKALFKNKRHVGNISALTFENQSQSVLRAKRSCP